MTEGRAAELFSWFRPASSLPGVGSTLLASLRKVTGQNEPRLRDLLFTLPRAERDLEPLAGSMAFEEGLEGAIALRVGRHRPPPRGGRAPYRIEAEADGTPVDLVFFKARGNYLESAFAEGQEVMVHGKLQRFRERWQIVHPELLPDDPRALALAGRIYPASEGLTQTRLRKIMAQALEMVDELPEWLDPHLVARDGLPGFRAALEIVHGTAEDGDIDKARHRLALDELLAMQIAMRLVRRSRQGDRGRPHRCEGILAGRLRSALPFSLTDAQLRSIDEIRGDLEHAQPMMRLLMGDVGSGKTLVAFMAMLHVVEAGRQVALMAPTEVLARQHARTLGQLGDRIGVAVGLLTGQGPAGERQAVRLALASGDLPIVVGTHALFQDGVSFHDLALAVIDEQHRFGVHQRLDLLHKGEAVDLLLMTATPIPRSLVLSHYGDVETSRLDEMPAGRQPVATVALPAGRIGEVVTAVGRALDRNERVYWICPVIDTSVDETAATAETRHELLSERFGALAGLVHGRLPAADKDARMASFASGETPLLVATTVVEVGVDVPEATVIVIDGAERFGLAQLHQLRGRVGRGDRASTCLLLYNPPLSRHARSRLKIIRESSDGFRIAEEDLRLRGPGEVLGVRQSGLPTMSFADIVEDGVALQTARDDARLVGRRDPELTSERGRALRLLLQLFERNEAVSLLAAG
ncbi:MAG: ATP-dependent DNA helicase RecG [Geminicoccaceae bacterium]